MELYEIRPDSALWKQAENASAKPKRSRTCLACPIYLTPSKCLGNFKASNKQFQQGSTSQVVQLALASFVKGGQGASERCRRLCESDSWPNARRGQLADVAGPTLLTFPAQRPSC